MQRIALILAAVAAALVIPTGPAAATPSCVYASWEDDDRDYTFVCYDFATDCARAGARVPVGPIHSVVTDYHCLP